MKVFLRGAPPASSSSPVLAFKKVVIFERVKRLLKAMKFLSKERKRFSKKSNFLTIKLLQKTHFYLRFSWNSAICDRRMSIKWIAWECDTRKSNFTDVFKFHKKINGRNVCPRMQFHKGSSPSKEHVLCECIFASTQCVMAPLCDYSFKNYFEFTYINFPVLSFVSANA